MATVRQLSVTKVAEILSKGTFAELVGAVEYAQFECKNQPYDTKTTKAKIELSKDVSALANSNGGYILIGVSTTRNPLHQGDEIVSVSEFASTLLDTDSYRKILGAYIYPPISDLKIEWHPSGADASKGIASIFVPSKSANEKPFIVAQSEKDSQVHGNMFGYFERVGDGALPTTVQLIRDTLKDGKRYADLLRRLENLEALIAKVSSSRPEQKRKNPITRERLIQRAADARIAANLLDSPLFVLIATPSEPVRLNDIFSSKSREFQLIKEPPVYRSNGFDLRTQNEVQLVRGELIRSVGWRKGLELWQDGTLIFVGRNDSDFLGWASKHDPDTNIYINNFVLTEVVSLFFTLAIQIYGHLKEPPEEIIVYFALTRNQGAKDVTYELSSLPIDRVYGSYGGMRVPANDKSFTMEFSLRDAIAEVEAVNLLKEIYHWFGIKDDDIPYIDFGAVPPRVNKAYYK